PSRPDTVIVPSRTGRRTERKLRSTYGVAEDSTLRLSTLGVADRGLFVPAKTRFGALTRATLSLPKAAPSTCSTRSTPIAARFSTALAKSPNQAGRGNFVGRFCETLRRLI